MKSLIADNLSKKYKKRLVVKNVSFEIKCNEIVGLLGPNGAGKTTCFYMIVGLVKADNGTIKIDDVDATRLPIHERAKLGLSYLPQEPSIFRKLTVAENLLAILELRFDLSKKARHQILNDLLEEFHVGHLRDNLGISLSGGERRRVEIARALAIDPSFILFDEPFAGIDPISIIDLKRIINQLRERGLGILITDHNVRETLSICNRAYIVSEGEIIAKGDSEAILANQKVREVYLGDDF